jgi:hypothetical protein
MKRLILLVLTALLVTSSCSHELEGPANPTVENRDLTYCGAETQSFVITGGNLSPMVREGATDEPRIDMPEVCLTPVGGGQTRCVADEDVEWVSQNEIRFTTRKSLGLAPGDYDVVVRNPDGTEAKGRITMKVLSDGPLILWADPTVVYNGISTQITIYGSNLGVIDSAALRHPDTLEETPIELTGETADNRIQAIVPQDTAVGTYDVIVRSENGCQADLLDGLDVTDTVDPTLVTAIDPTFGWTEAATPVTILGAGFTAVPRAYLNPDQPAPGTVASALASVAFVSDSRLTGIVPEGLPPGVYDLIVVNPDQRVGVLDNAFTVTADDPPVINNISPNYLDNSGDKTVTVEGENFRDGAMVTATCRNVDGTGETILDGTGITVSADGTSLQVTLPVGTLPQGTVCVVRVTNSDGSYFDYSAVGIANPSSNLNDFVTGPEMTAARRAPAVAAARATRAARFVYAIGGDDGSPAGAMTSVESTPIDIFGAPGVWSVQPVSLPEPRTLASVVAVGRFLYLVGGNDGSAATPDVLRAQVLDPLAAPQIVDVSARRAEGAEGIGAGVWYYRVSAVMADSDPSNPGGETLPSDPLVINLSQRTEGTLVLTLIWEPVPGAQSYRIYRSPTGDLPVGSEQLIAEVPGGDTTTYEDTVAPGPSSGPPPRPLGSTGEWMTLPSLSTAREAPGVTAGRDPADPAMWHVYAIGGRTAGAGSELASTERLTVTINVDESHALPAAWIAGADISAGRAELTAFSLSHSEAVQVPGGTTYIYAGGGTPSANVDVAQVAAGGDLVWSAADAMSPQRAGYAGLAGAGFLFAFGGAQGSPSDSNASAEIDPSAVPALINWNNEGVRLIVGRYLAGSAVESAFIYVVGGDTATGPTASTERTVL